MVVDYMESHSASHSDGSHRRNKLTAARKHLEQRFAVEDHPARDGRLVVCDKLPS
ncbi:hypothetical protein [Streptomyces sp. CB00455]|uniref:hypothetical protein n=1 Tax=Streptomyces sp. CB00455 TaxID=1703927 RepID=UPI000B18C4F8|nr:hypothetical protein [Streptomyces sp. CB00455]